MNKPNCKGFYSAAVMPSIWPNNADSKTLLLSRGKVSALAMMMWSRKAFYSTRGHLVLGHDEAEL